MLSYEKTSREYFSFLLQIYAIPTVLALNESGKSPPRELKELEKAAMLKRSKAFSEMSCSSVLTVFIP